MKYISAIAIFLASVDAAKIHGIADDLKFPKDYPGTYYTERLAPKSDYIAPYAPPRIVPVTDATPHESPRTYTMPDSTSYKPMI